MKIIGFDLGDGESAVAWMRPGKRAEPQMIELRGRKSVITALGSHKEKGLLIGGLCGVLLALLLLIGGIADGKGPTWGYAVLEWAVLTVCSAAGGVLGVNRRHP